MTDLFSGEWMGKFQDAWNGEETLAGELAKIGFNSVIGYGFKGDDRPVGVLIVEQGQVVSAGAFDGEALDWDLRASDSDWRAWMKKPPGLIGLGMAYTSGKLKFKVGDYAGMIKDPRMAGPFIKSFSMMGKV